MTSPTILRTALLFSALALLAAMSLPQELHAQSTVHGALAGIVVDGAGRPVHDAEVRISDRVSGAARRLNTGRDGAFLFGLLSPATYDLAVEALGFRPVRYLGVTVVAGTTPTIRIALKTEAPPVVRIDTVRAPPARALLHSRGCKRAATATSSVVAALPATRLCSRPSPTRSRSKGFHGASPTSWSTARASAP